MSKARGKFIVIEGVDGSGKSTLVQELARKFPIGTVVHTREPHSASDGYQTIHRQMTGEANVSPKMMAHAFRLNRLDHCSRVISPMLNDGKHVISDRYIVSSLVYQSVADNGAQLNDAEAVSNYLQHTNTPEYIQPDLILYIDTDSETCLKRLQARKKHDALDIDQLSKIEAYRGYYARILLLLYSDRTVVLNGNQDIDDLVFDAVVELCALGVEL